MTWPEALRRLGANPLLRKPLRTQGGARSLALFGGYVGILVVLLAIPVVLSVVQNRPSFPLKEAWQVGYGLSMTGHVIGLFLVGMGRIMGTVSRERSRNTFPGLLLTPLRPMETAVGLWLGESWIFLSASAVLALATLVAAMGAKVPVLEWAGTWAALLASACFLQTLGLLVARLHPKPEQAQGIVVGILVLLWMLSSAAFALSRAAAHWPVDLIWLTPGPALGIVWGERSLRAMGAAGYLVAVALGSCGTALCLLAFARKLHDPLRPSLPRRLVLVLSLLLGLYAGVRLRGADGEAWFYASVSTVLGWGLLCAFLLVPSSAALEAGLWRRVGDGILGERSPGRRALVLSLGLLLLGLWIPHAIQDTPPDRGSRWGYQVRSLPWSPYASCLLAWLWASLGVLAFAEVLSFCRALFPRRGTLAAVMMFGLGGLLPFVAVSLLWSRAHPYESPPTWYAFWGCLADPKDWDCLRGIGVWILLWIFFGALARWRERELEARVSARRDAVLSLPENGDSREPRGDPPRPGSRTGEGTP